MKIAAYEKYPVRECRSMHSCAECGKDIKLGDFYRDGGYGRRVHEICFQAAKMEKEYKESAPIPQQTNGETCTCHLMGGGKMCKHCLNKIIGGTFI